MLSVKLDTSRFYPDNLDLRMPPQPQACHIKCNVWLYVNQIFIFGAISTLICAGEMQRSSRRVI